MSTRYPILLVDDDNGTVLVRAPDLPEAVTFGDDRSEALVRAVEAIETAIMGRIADREEIPIPGGVADAWVSLPSLSAAKISLYQAMREDGLGKADLAKRLGWHLPQVDRLLDLSHASRLDLIERALETLGRVLVVSVDRAA